MQSPHGRIISIDSDHAEKVVVEVEAAVACRRCAQGKGCGAGLIGGPSQLRQVSALLVEGLKVQRGDSVSLELAPGNLLRAASIVYGLPLVGALSGALLALVMDIGDLAAGA
ncbi:MAG TPA: SoxR reducing system RseC family protein, partial [Woeseiaceae bacterium]|nr:SoxR reducing system RseC family protein [Woeseiaceae bacterium]